MHKDSKIYIAGHRGLVGSAILRTLEDLGYTNIITRSHEELDLTNQEKVKSFFEIEKPEYVFLAAAKVGGIMANSKYPADFILNNLLIQNNIIQSSYENNVKKLLFLGSSCIYPKESLVPIKEEYLLSGKLEETNKPYAIAKIAGITLCQSFNKQYGTNYISVMPTNLYGSGDNFDLESSHVIPALIRKFDDAKKNNAENVVLWGSGNPMREFLYVDDLASACVFLMNSNSGIDLINIGYGSDVTISELANQIKDCVGYDGGVLWDSTKPDGTYRKLMDSSILNNLGWKPKVDLKTGLQMTYKWYKENNI
ncbi:MAG: GDP-L-fucose synthase [Candidatus Paceibacterota bacterium]